MEIKLWVVVVIGLAAFEAGFIVCEALRWLLERLDKREGKG
jgi:hypothetical protein